jgi:hypothetical protein
MICHSSQAPKIRSQSQLDEWTAQRIFGNGRMIYPLISQYPHENSIKSMGISGT